MAKRDKIQKRARFVQLLTRWTYLQSLSLIRDHLDPEGLPNDDHIARELAAIGSLKASHDYRLRFLREAETYGPGEDL